jgi:TM2 domain-containing membrane protein YozV
MVMGKSSGTAFLLWMTCLFGVCGLHRFYLGRYGTGVLWLLTFGLFGVGQFVDLFLINGMVRKENREDLDSRLLQAVLRAPRPAAPATMPTADPAPEAVSELSLEQQALRVDQLRAAFSSAMPSRS